MTGTIIGKDTSFPSLRAVVRHLDKVGFKVSKSKISRDKAKNLIRVNDDGTVLEAEVRAYAATLERKDGNIDDLSDIHARKTAKEVESLDLKVKRQTWEFERDQGKYIPKKNVEVEQAARAMVLDSGLRHMFNVNVREFIGLVGGNIAKSPDLLEAMNARLDELLNSFADTGNFQVLFKEED